jgi:hypothetical protein
MKRIESTQMKVEHWHCQDKYSSEQLDYQNMLGVCLGNEGQTPDKQSCDTRKSNADLKYNPANTSTSHRMESQLHFLGDGKIQSHDIDCDRQLNAVLNLNDAPRLKANRKAIWDAVHDTLHAKRGTCTVAEIEKWLDKWKTPDATGRLREYCAVAIYYLGKRQAKA